MTTVLQMNTINKPATSLYLEYGMPQGGVIVYTKPGSPEWCIFIDSISVDLVHVRPDRSGIPYNYLLLVEADISLRYYQYTVATEFMFQFAVHLDSLV